MLLNPLSVRERKPAFSTLPDFMREKIDKALGCQVLNGSTVYQGFSAAANFILDLADGRKIFAKGNHPGERSHGMQNLRQEIAIYTHIPQLKRLSPRYLGWVAEDHNEDGWALGLWEALATTAAPPSLPKVLERLAFWRTAAPSPFLSSAENTPYIRDFLTPDKKWRRLKEPVICAAFAAAFQNPLKAEEWLHAHLDFFIAAQKTAATLQMKQGPLHGDLRCDNILQEEASGDVFFVDWPNACWGPLAFDTVFLGASREAFGEGSMEDVSGDISPLDIEHMAILVAGSFAVHMGRPVPEAMPRLRWMQQSLFLALMHFLERQKTIDSLPFLKGQNT